MAAAAGAMSNGVYGGFLGTKGFMREIGSGSWVCGIGGAGGGGGNVRVGLRYGGIRSVPTVW